jgi:predicted nuclease with TOPRIM domain
MIGDPGKPSLGLELTDELDLALEQKLDLLMGRLEHIEKKLEEGAAEFAAARTERAQLRENVQTIADGLRQIKHQSDEHAKKLTDQGLVIAHIEDDVTDMRPAGEFFRDVLGGVRVGKWIAAVVGSMTGIALAVLGIISFFRGQP